MSSWIIGLAFLVITIALVIRQLNTSRSDETPRCPRCGHEKLEGQRRCSKCGVPFQVYEVVTAAKLEANQESGQLHATVRADVCVGCGACVPACPEDGAIRMQGKIAVVDTAVCVAHGDCVQACPVGAIAMGSGDDVQRMEVPEVGADFQTNVRGLFIAGELGGRGLIKNAVNEGRLAAESVAHMLQNARLQDDDEIPFVIVGSGPAGLSAALEAKRLGVEYAVLEQGSLADTIRKYPRKKLLLAEPVNIPLFGSLWLADGSKEVLLDVWEKVVAEQDLAIRTHTKVQRVGRREGGGFLLECDNGSVKARYVLLALGRRGTPRKLGVPGEEADKVYYDVVEMEAFAGDRVLVVGGGDSALESAIGLAHQPNTTVHLSYRKDNFERAKERNRKKLDKAISAGRVHLLLQSTVLEIRPDFVRLEMGDGEVELPNDTVIIRIGGEPPSRFLEDAGVATVVRGVRMEPAMTDLP